MNQSRLTFTIALYYFSIFAFTSCNPYKKIIDAKKGMNGNSYTLIKAGDKDLSNTHTLGTGDNSVAAYYSLTESEKESLNDFEGFDKEKDIVLILRPDHIKTKPQVIPLYEYLSEVESQLAYISNNITLSEKLLSIEKEIGELKAILDAEQLANTKIGDQLKSTISTDKNLIEKVEALTALFQTINERIP